MAAKKKHFTGPEMSALSGPLTAEQTKLATASFFIAARVANCAWSFLKSFEAQDILALETHQKELRDALHDYSPGNWPVTGVSETSKEYSRERLQAFFSVAEQLPDKAAILEALYQFISQEYE